MNTQDLLQKLDASCAVLHSVANQHPKPSAEHQSIELATRALVFACTQTPEQFAAFLRDFDADVTDEQKARLRGFGIDTNG